MYGALCILLQGVLKPVGACRVPGLGRCLFTVQGFGCRVWGLLFKGFGLGFRVWDFWDTFS